MSRVTALVERLAPDSIALLERAARQRIADAEDLNRNGRRLPAIYFLGFAVEMLLAAAYFRRLGYRPREPIEPRDRKSTMTQLRHTKDEEGEVLMSGDPHPIPGWAKAIIWLRTNQGTTSNGERERMKAALKNSERIYRHWRPELRYKCADVSEDQFEEAFHAADWFVQNSNRL